MRHDINSVVQGNDPGGEPGYYDKNPFRKADLVRILEHLTGDADPSMEKSRIRFEVLQAMGEDPNPFDATTPMRKHEIRTLHEMIVED